MPWYWVPLLVFLSFFVGMVVGVALADLDHDHRAPRG